VFVDFPDVSRATEALGRLAQLDFLGARLRVQYAAPLGAAAAASADPAPATSSAVGAAAPRLRPRPQRRKRRRPLAPGTILETAAFDPAPPPNAPAPLAPTHGCVV